MERCLEQMIHFMVTLIILHWDICDLALGLVRVPNVQILSHSHLNVSLGTPICNSLISEVPFLPCQVGLE